MILLRARESGSSDWEEITFSGDREQEFLGILADALVQRDLIVQWRLDGRAWEDLE